MRVSVASVAQAGEAEVGDPDFADAVQQQVRRLDVAVYDAAFVRRVQGAGRVDADADNTTDILVDHRFASVPVRRPRSQERSLRGHQRSRRRVQFRAIGTFRPAALLHFSDDAVQRLPVDELHRIVVDAAFHADGEDGDDVRMVQLSGRLGLVLETGDLAAVQHGSEGEHFQGHAAAQRDLLGLVHNAHPAAANLPQKAKIA